PVIEAGSFNFYVHQNLRVYVNVSQGQSVLSSYATAWGGDKVAKSSNIFERGSHNFPLIQIYSITRQGEEQHITSKDFRAEFISAASLPSLQDEVEGRGMSTGYYKNKTDDSVLISAKEVVKDAVLKIYVKWENA
ncbi:MAG: hypothetical protein PHC84_04230, partial [Clostridia bacterium]|nr:hypothetical protein [Clostridia bacterium]